MVLLAQPRHPGDVSRPHLPQAYGLQQVLLDRFELAQRLHVQLKEKEQK